MTMRIPSSPAVVTSSNRSVEEQWIKNAPPEMQAGLKAQLHQATQGHSIMDGGCFPPPPPFRRPDAGTRAEQGDQLHQIADGVRNGSITEQEASSLLEEQKAIANAQKEAMADGHLSLGERLKLAVMQGRAENHINRAEHNFSRDVFAPLDSTAQKQANQIDQIANGRTNGNITNSEAGALLGAAGGHRRGPQQRRVHREADDRHPAEPGSARHHHPQPPGHAARLQAVLPEQHRRVVEAAASRAIWGCGTSGRPCPRWAWPPPHRTHGAPATGACERVGLLISLSTPGTAYVDDAIVVRTRRR